MSLITRIVLFGYTIIIISYTMIILSDSSQLNHEKTKKLTAVIWCLRGTVDVYIDSDCADHVLDCLDIYDSYLYEYDRDLWHGHESWLRRWLLQDTHHRRLITKKFLNLRRKERQQTKKLDKYRFESQRTNPRTYRKTQIKKSLTYFKSIIIPRQFTTEFVDETLQKYQKLINYCARSKKIYPPYLLRQLGIINEWFPYNAFPTIERT